MWFVIGEDRYSEEYAGWGVGPKEAFEMLSSMETVDIDTLRWFHCEKPAKVSVIAKYEFKVIE